MHEEAMHPMAQAEDLFSSAENSLGSLAGGSNKPKRFPMFVLPSSRVLALERIPTHEAIRAELVEWHEGMDKVLFVSQTWLARAHPDNAQNAKLALLQSFLREAASGKRSIQPSWDAQIVWGNKLRISAKALRAIEYVWFDLWGVPQQDTARQVDAIATIPQYVAQSSFFLVCCPGACLHENGSVRDVRAWVSRGWCRVELLCNVLSPRAKPLIIMESESEAWTLGPAGVIGRDWITCPVGLADFSYEADRVALGPVIERVIDERVAARRAEGTEEGLRWYRFLRAMKEWLLVGTNVEVAAAPTYAAWMKEFQFGSATEVDSHGWGPPSCRGGATSLRRCWTRARASRRCCAATTQPSARSKVGPCCTWRRWSARTTRR